MSVSLRVRVVRCDAALQGRAKVLDQRAAAARALAGLGLVDPPRVPDGPPLPTADGTHWSVSHTTGAAGAAVAPFAVGLDLERERELRPELVRRFLAPDEPELEPLAAWTAKEAVLKKIGIGMAGLSRCRIIEWPNRWQVRLEFDGAFHNAYFCWESGFVGALSHDGPQDGSLQWIWDR